MAGNVKKMLDEIIRQKSGGNITIATCLKAKLTLKGLNPDKFTAQSQDDPGLIGKVKDAAREMGVNL